MNRAIRFRAWDKKANSMSAVDWDMNKWEHYEPERYITMQFTGLHDRNDREIFEGDIVERYYPKDNELEQPENESYSDWVNKLPPDEIIRKRGVVTFYPKQGFKAVQGSARRSISVEEHCEVLGNIHENPELLKEGHE